MTGASIVWVQSFVTDDKIYCLYVAPDEETVKQHAQKGERKGLEEIVHADASSHRRT
jgi:hypothetical protein